LREARFPEQGPENHAHDERSGQIHGIVLPAASPNRQASEQGKQALHDSRCNMEGKKDTVEIEIALQYNDSYTKTYSRSPTRSNGGWRHAPFRFPLGANAHHQ